MKIARLVIGLLVLASCTKAPPTPAGLRVGLITPGSVTDAAWNSGAYQGLQRIHDSLGVPVSHVEARTPAAQEEALRAYAAEGYGLVFAHGYEFQDMAERVSAQYPGTVFIVTSGARTMHRVAPLVFRLEEASYLAGMVAGSLTQTGVIGFVGGVELPPVKAAYQGWVNGAMATNPQVKTRFTYLNNWDDAAMGREAAMALVRAGVDVFHHNADAAALGVFQTAKETPGVLVFGANADQSNLAPASVPGSAVIDLPRAFLAVAREVQKGKFHPRVIEFGLEGGVVRYDPNPAYPGTLPAELGPRLEAARDSMIAGSLRPAQPPKAARAGRPTSATAAR